MSSGGCSLESICNSTYIHRNTHTYTYNKYDKIQFLLVYYLLLLASLSNEPINNICGFMKFTLTESFSSAEKNHLPLLVGEVFSIWGHIKIFQAIRFTWERRRVIVYCQFLRNEIQSCWLRVSCTASGPRASLTRIRGPTQKHGPAPEPKAMSSCRQHCGVYIRHLFPLRTLSSS